jgi:iron complex outermembrane receptor protein
MAVQPVMAATLEDLSRLSIEDLANIEVTSVSKRPEPLSKAAASVYVITGDDIRRSGVTSLPEALRLAPNLEVARVGASSYAISARGFNRFEVSNKLLVLIDGRTVYSPLHAGVFWDTPNVMLEDIDRIEVISGSGGTLYGANAVNGVINVITKSSADTKGGLASAQFGDVDRSGALRYGGSLGARGSYRVYGLGFQRGHTVHADGTSTGDDWAARQGGFRTDWHTFGNAFTVQGDIFSDPFDSGGRATGGNILARWTHTLSADSAVDVQTYYDKVERNTPGVFDSLETADFQVQHNFSWGDAHKIVWGGGYRVLQDQFINTLNGFVLVPDSRTLTLGNVFAQDAISLADDLKLTLGTKLEDSSYTGFEYMPDARLGWEVTDSDFLWASVSRSVRTPSRIERELQFPGVLLPAPNFRSEKLIAYEVGYRGQLSPDALASVSFYYNDYDDIRATELGPGGTTPVQLGNGIAGSTYGMEAWGEYRLQPWWRLKPGLNIIRKHLYLKDGATDTSGRQGTGNDPDYQFSLRSSMDLRDNVEIDVGFRSVDNLTNPIIPAYYEFDARVGWHVTDRLELSLAAFNIFDDHHPETGSAPASEIRRTVYAGARWRF